MTSWHSFMDRNPEAMQVVLVTSESWKFPKVLQFVPWEQQHRLYEVEGQERFYYYPERMHWVPIPGKPSQQKPFPKDSEFKPFRPRPIT